MKLRIDGVDYETSLKSISYWEILRMSGRARDSIRVILYSRGDIHGYLKDGDSVEVFGDLVFRIVEV